MVPTLYCSKFTPLLHIPTLTHLHLLTPQRSMLSSYPYNGSTMPLISDFTPIPELYSDDGDLHLIFLQGNGVYFHEKTTDPWYQATQLGPSFYTSLNITQNVYQPREAASPLACVEKYQFCNADRECGPLTAQERAIREGASLFNMPNFTSALANDVVPEDPVSSRFYWFYLVLFRMATDVDIMLWNLGSKALMSKQSLFDGIMGSLPDDQWQLDVKYWWATRLAGIQAAFVNTVFDTRNARLDEFLIRPYNSYMREMCNNQVRHPSPLVHALVNIRHRCSGQN